jgi:hypothetical protein
MGQFCSITEHTWWKAGNGGHFGGDTLQDFCLQGVESIRKTPCQPCPVYRKCWQHGGKAMLAREGTLPKFAVGSEVRVKKGVAAPNYPDVPLVGWRGRVSQVSGTIYLVHWNEVTLEAVRPSYVERWLWDGVDFQAVWLQEMMLEADPGEPLCIEQAREGAGLPR